MVLNNIERTIFLLPYVSSFLHSNAIIRILEDGEGAALMIAAAEIGQGSETVLLQVATEALEENRLTAETTAQPAQAPLDR